MHNCQNNANVSVSPFLVTAGSNISFSYEERSLSFLLHTCTRAPTHRHTRRMESLVKRGVKKSVITTLRATSKDPPLEIRVK